MQDVYIQNLSVVSLSFSGRVTFRALLGTLLNNMLHQTQGESGL